MHMRIRAVAALLCCAIGIEGCASSSATDAWPDKTVSPSQLRLAEPLQLRMPRQNTNDPMPNGTAVLRVHVDERGTVRKTSLVTSSGSAVLDSAAARALVGAKFIPYREAGATIPVTTLLPINVKASAQCRGLSPLDC
ncbi:energy transducer TonB [Variovorax sp. V116]|uniref:energy transducer TonB n=1 Tax=Variovorax sp. V116 TaxID=3065953 RepID=UPI0034E8E0B2